MISYRSADILERVKQQQEKEEKLRNEIYCAKMLFDMWRRHHSVRDWKEFWSDRNPSTLLQILHWSTNIFTEEVMEALPTMFPEIRIMIDDPEFRDVCYEEAKKLGWNGIQRKADILKRFKEPPKEEHTVKLGGPMITNAGSAYCRLYWQAGIPAKKLVMEVNRILNGYDDFRIINTTNGGVAGWQSQTYANMEQVLDNLEQVMNGIKALDFVKEVKPDFWPDEVNIIITYLV